MSKNENLNDFLKKTCVLGGVTMMLTNPFFDVFFCDDKIFNILKKTT